MLRPRLLREAVQVAVEGATHRAGERGRERNQRIPRQGDVEVLAPRNEDRRDVIDHAFPLAVTLTVGGNGGSELHFHQRARREHAQRAVAQLHLGTDLHFQQTVGAEYVGIFDRE